MFDDLSVATSCYFTSRELYSLLAFHIRDNNMGKIAYVARFAILIGTKDALYSFTLENGCQFVKSYIVPVTNIIALNETDTSIIREQ
jgi:hypothetical protein